MTGRISNTIAIAATVCACAAPRTVTLPEVRGNAVASTDDGTPLQHSAASIDAFCSPIRGEEPGPTNGACDNRHGACEASSVQGVSSVSIVRWNGGSSLDTHEDVAIETKRGVFFADLGLVVAMCDPEDLGAPNGNVSIEADGVRRVRLTYLAFDRHVRVSPDSPPNRKQTCNVTCTLHDTPLCTAPACGDWADER